MRGSPHPRPFVQGSAPSRCALLLQTRLCRFRLTLCTCPQRGVAVPLSNQQSCALGSRHVDRHTGGCVHLPRVNPEHRAPGQPVSDVPFAVRVHPPTGSCRPCGARRLRTSHDPGTACRCSRDHPGSRQPHPPNTGSSGFGCPRQAICTCPRLRGTPQAAGFNELYLHLDQTAVAPPIAETARIKL